MPQRRRSRATLRSQRGAVTRGKIFAGLCIAGACTVAGYAWLTKSRTDVAETAPSVPPSPPPSPPATVPESTETAASPPSEGAPPAPPKASVSEKPRKKPPAATAQGAREPKKETPSASASSFAPTRVYFRYNKPDAHYGKVAYVEATDPDSPHFVDQLACEVVYVAGGEGICLSAKRGVVTTYSGRLFDTATYSVHAQFALNGVPSRSRVSRDGKLAAFTVFVSGHGYTQLDFSTQTLLLDARTGAVIADLESFAVTRDGKPFKEADFNFWGVTFTPDAREFYATLSSGGEHYLVRGNIEKRSATVIHSNVECPSLSPDGTRVAYKKRFRINDRIVWELHVLDLATGKETALNEKRSIDDQLEWLDARRVLYSVPEGEASPSTDVWVVAADGSGQPRPYLKTAFSPAAVR